MSAAEADVALTSTNASSLRAPPIVELGDTLRLLLIEDSPSDCDLIRELLRDELSHGQVDAAPTLTTALQRLASVQYDLILSDLSLPDADGERVVQAVREAAPRTPLIVLTGRVDRHLAMWALAAGAQDYLVKGDHDGPRLADAVLRGLQRSRAEHQAHARLVTALRLQSEATERLRALDLARNEFVATASHELRTPLASIAASAELLQDTAGLDDAQAGLVDAIVRNAARLNALTDDLLLLSSFSSSSSLRDVRAVDMREVVSSTCRQLAPSAQAKGVELAWQVPDDSLVVAGDASELQRLVLNLTSNAIKFTPAPGVVTCGLHATTGGQVAVVVTDTGVGIPPDEEHRIFEKFFRGAWAHERAVQGTGLGLHIAAVVVERHHGRIRVDSSPSGTTFTVCLPSAREPREDAGPVLWPDQGSTPALPPAPLALDQAGEHGLGDALTVLEDAVRCARRAGERHPVGDVLRLVRTRVRGSGAEAETARQILDALVEAAQETSSTAYASAPPPGAAPLVGDRVDPGPTPELTEEARAYLDRLLDGDAPGATALAHRFVEHGMSPLDVLVDVLEPAQHRVGDLWDAGQLTVHQEHFATTVAHRVLGELLSPAVDPSAPARRLVAVYAPGCRHRLGLRFITDLLAAQGWIATYAAPDLEARDLPALLVEQDAELLLVSASMPAEVVALRPLISAVREDPRTGTVTILAGGRAFNQSPDLAGEIGADGWAQDAREALVLCERLRSSPA